MKCNRTEYMIRQPIPEDEVNKEIKLEGECNFIIGVLGREEEESDNVSTFVMGEFSDRRIIAAISSLEKLQRLLIAHTVERMKGDPIRNLGFTKALMKALDEIDNDNLGGVFNDVPQ